MLNDVWLKMAEFLGRLNGESISRESYVRTPEYEKALEAWKEKEQEWEDFLETLSAEQREAGGNQRMSGGFRICTGAAGVYTRVCGLCAGIGTYGDA